MFDPKVEPERDETQRGAPGAPYDIVLGADLLYNPSLYTLLLPTVLQLLAIDANAGSDRGQGTGESHHDHHGHQEQEDQILTQNQCGSQSTVVYMCYMERGGEDAFFAEAEARGVVCDRPRLSTSLALLGEELGCVMVRMQNAKAIAAGASPSSAFRVEQVQG